MIDPDLLKYYREEKGLSIRELSNKIRIAKRKIKEWEDGELEPTEKELNYLCKFYKINVEDLMYAEESNHRRILTTSIILGIIGIILGGLINSISISILLTIVLIAIYLLLLNIRKSYQITKTKDEPVPKSLFSLMLDIESKKNRIKIYLIESILIANVYVLFTIICRVLDLDNLIISINIFKNNDLNYALISIIIFTLLGLISFLIEYVFGEIIVKKYKGE